MRKIWIVVILYLFTVTGCGKGNESNIISDYSNTNGCFMRNSNVVEGVNAYYFVMGNENNYYLEAIDKNTFDSEILCSKINCEHVDGKITKNCDAFLGNVLIDSVNYYKGYIYYIDYSELTNKCTLYRVSENGSEHEELFEIGVVPDNASDYVCYVITDQSIYYSLSVINTNNNNTVCINKYSFESKRIDNICDYEDSAAMLYDLKICNGWLYFRKSKAEGIFNSTLERINIENGQIEDVAEGVCSYITKNESIEVWKISDGIYEYDLQNRVTKRLFESTDETKIGFLATNGNVDYIFNMPNKYYNKNTDVFFSNIEKERIASKVSTNISEGIIIPVYVAKDCIFVNKFDKKGTSYAIIKIENGKISNDYYEIN